MHENEIGTVIVDCAVHLHQALGPGLLEKVYEVTLARQLESGGFQFNTKLQRPLNMRVNISKEDSVPIGG
jgi:GxxExxY protein